jgi:parallel beta-helix repeat protein
MIERQRLPLVVAAASLAAAATLLLMSLLGGSSPARASPAAATRYVSATDPTCGEQSLCYATIQAAVNAADPGDEILVAAGVYTTSGVTEVLHLDRGVAIRGGYTTTGWTRDLGAYTTTLDAEEQGRVVYIHGDITPTLEGLHIVNGQTDTDHGAGLYVDHAHPIVSACQIYSNTVAGATYRGGGIYLSDGDRAQFVSNDIRDNSAGRAGGGVYVHSSDAVSLTGNRIHDNSADNYGGGGVYIYSSQRATLKGNDVFSNTSASGNGGGITVFSSNDAALADNDVFYNEAGWYGGGIHIQFSDNARLESNRVTENRIRYGTSTGAGIHINESTAHLLHTTLARNTGAGGQGIYLEDWDLGSIPTRVWMTNTILVSHTVGIALHPQATATLTHTLWGAGSWANQAPWTGSGTLYTGTLAANWWEEPGFAAPDHGDYHLGPGSPAIDRGMNTAVATDVDGERRRIGAYPDLGADEAPRWVFLPLLLSDCP